MSLLFICCQPIHASAYWSQMVPTCLHLFCRPLYFLFSFTLFFQSVALIPRVLSFPLSLYVHWSWSLPSVCFSHLHHHCSVFVFPEHFAHCHLSSQPSGSPFSLSSMLVCYGLYPMSPKNCMCSETGLVECDWILGVFSWLGVLGVGLEGHLSPLSLPFSLCFFLPYLSSFSFTVLLAMLQTWIEASRM